MSKHSHQTRLSEDPLENAHRLLGQCVLFRGLGSAERSELVAQARIRHFAAGETIFLMGSPGDSMMAVLTGNVRISVSSPEGREILLAILYPGEIFGEIALLDGKERTADARAITKCELAILRRSDVMAFLRREPNACFSLVEVLCERLRQTDQHIAEVALLQLPARLAKVLLRMAKPEPVRPEGHSGTTIRLSQRELGNMVGAARESVNKCFREWQRSGIVRIEGNFITIADRTALEEIAGPS